MTRTPPITTPPTRDLTARPPILRNAEPADVDAIAELAVRTFFETFEQHCAPSDMEAYLRQAFSVEQTRSEVLDPNSVFFLAFVGDDSGPPVGYAKLRLGASEDCVRGPVPIELERLYVDRSAIGHGLGAALMKHCLAEARARGFLTMWLGVWEHNDRAKRFYERFGFEVVGSHIFTIGTDDQTDLVMERAILAPPTSKQI